IRTDSTVLGDPAVFCADFLYAEGCTFVGLVQQYFARETSCAELHWYSWRNYRGNLLSIHWSGRVPFNGDSARIRGGSTVLSRIARRSAFGLDLSIYLIWCLCAACGTVSFAGLARRRHD